MSWLARLELGLLKRELVEQANRRRTYVIRTVYCVILFALFLLLLAGRFTGEVPAEAKGVGAELFYLVLGLQLIGIYALLPAMMADAITRERELNSLDLIVLTQMSLWDIVLQKLLSRLFPMATFLMLTLPLMAVAYAYGGVQGLWSTIYIVLLTCFQVGAICLFLAADAPKTSTAMLSCYIRLPVITIVLLVLSGCINVPVAMLFGFVFQFIEVPLVFVPALALRSGTVPPLWVTIASTLPALGIGVWYLMRTRALLERVIEAHGGKPLQPTFELARVEEERSVRARGRMPGDRPVAWMELTSRLMGQLQKVYCFAMLVNLPIFLWLAAAVGSDSYMPQQEGLSVLILFMWLCTFGLLAMVAASAFSGERAGQTLAILLSTPMTTPELVTQKLAGARRTAVLLAIPLALTIFTEWVLENFGRHTTADRGLLYLACSAAAIAIYFPLAIWLGALIGMWIRDRGRAVVITLCVLLIWVFALPAMMDAVVTVFDVPPPARMVFALAMPHRILMANEWGELYQFGGWIWNWFFMLLNFTLYAALVWFLRRWCLGHGDEWLGRVPQPPGSAPEAASHPQAPHTKPRKEALS